VISFQREAKTYQGNCVPFDSSIAAIYYVEFILLFISLIRSSVDIGF
jgi:hypothetical protein